MALQCVWNTLIGALHYIVRPDSHLFLYVARLGPISLRRSGLKETRQEAVRFVPHRVRENLLVFQVLFATPLRVGPARVHSACCGCPTQTPKNVRGGIKQPCRKDLAHTGFALI